MVDRNLGLMKKSTDSNPLNVEFTTAHRLQNDHVETTNLAILYEELFNLKNF